MSSKLLLGTTRVEIVNTMLYNGRTGVLHPTSGHPEDFWDYTVVLDATREEPSMRIGITNSQFSKV